MPKGHNFYVKFSDKVVDGTRCRDGSQDVCIDGKCEVSIFSFYHHIFQFPRVSFPCDSGKN